MTECYHEHDGCECEALTKDLNSELVRWRELPRTVAKLLNRPENYWETHVNQPLAMASTFALMLKYPSIHRDSYKILHRKITEGLVRCAEDEYLGRLGPEAFKHIPSSAPILHAVVSMVASSVVNIVMEWEKEQDR